MHKNFILIVIFQMFTFYQFICARYKFCFLRWFINSSQHYSAFKIFSTFWGLISQSFLCFNYIQSVQISHAVYSFYITFYIGWICDFFDVLSFDISTTSWCSWIDLSVDFHWKTIGNIAKCFFRCFISGIFYW